MEMPRLSVVLPLYQGRAFLDRVLPPLLAARDAGDLLEVLIVDDGSTDGGPEFCAELGLSVFPAWEKQCSDDSIGGTGPGRPGGPGAARNVGATHARGDVLFFVDADVVLHADAVALVRRAFAEDRSLSALFGSYDATPAHRGWISQYRNLLHHWTHQQGDEEAGTFWAGCGAVRREVFERLGGFDVARFPTSSIEDIELGMRIVDDGGRIRLRKDLLSTHLKRWSFVGMVTTDVLRRALPWSRLLLERGGGGDLNVSGSERRRAALACLLWASLCVAPWRPEVLWLSGLLVMLVWFEGRGFYALVLRSAGLGPFVTALVLHPLYYGYATATYAYCLLASLVRGTPSPSTP